MFPQYLEFSPQGNESFPFDLEAECTEIHDLNSSLQCLFVMTAEDCVEIIEYLDYNYFMFCYYSLEEGIPAVITCMLWLLILFISLGVTSNYFLCPALFAISKHLRLSQNVAGVTLLAFGNGAPDIFSSVAGLQKASAELAIASLVGAGVFVTTVVAGSVFLVQSFNLMIRPFLRDICFYIVASSWAFALFFTGTDYLYHGIGFVALYFVYIVVVLVSRLIYVRRNHNKKNEKNGGHVDNARTTMRSMSPLVRMAKTFKKLADNLDINFMSYSDYHASPGLKMKGMKYKPGDDPEISGVVLKAFYFCDIDWFEEPYDLTQERKIYAIGTDTSNDDVTKNGDQYAQKTSGTTSTEKLCLRDEIVRDRGELWELMRQICPVNLHKWPKLKWWEKLMAYVKSPAILAMRITVPVINTSNEKDSWCRPLACLHCIMGPLFIVFVSEKAFMLIGGAVPLAVIVILVCCAISVTVFCTSQRYDPPLYYSAFAYLGFAVAVTWTYCLANEIVALLQVFGVVFNLSDAVLGLTVLAWGNSLSDFLSNLAVARKEFPRMGISACYGGPLLALLLGLGIPCIIEIVKGRAPPKYPLVFTGQFIILFSTIGISLLTTTITMVLLKFNTSKVYGLFLLLLYSAFVTLSVLDESRVFQIKV